MNLSIKRIRGQCYDGASTMAGCRNVLAKLIQDNEPRALYTHCYGHALNLAACDAVKGCKVMKNALDLTNKITKLVKYSPRRDAIFQTLKSELAPGNIGVRVLCPTRWTVRAEALASILSNYEVLMKLWEEAVYVTWNMIRGLLRIFGEVELRRPLERATLTEYFDACYVSI